MIIFEPHITDVLFCVIFFLAFKHSRVNIPVYGFIMTMSVNVQSCLSLSHWMSCICVSGLSPLWNGQNTGRGVKMDQKSPNY